MPRGVPKSGFRLTQKRINQGLTRDTLPMVSQIQTQLVAPLSLPIHLETEEEIEHRLQTRFSALERFCKATTVGKNPSMILSGPTGVGKSFTVGKTLAAAGNSIYATVIKGFVRSTGLYKTLYEFRHPNSVVVFDDADSVFDDATSLNLLKAATDSTKRRRLHWLSETDMKDEDGSPIERQFDFEGSVIFITNYDFEDMIKRGSKLSPHFEALMSRSHYLDLSMKSTLDYIVRIKQVVRDHNMLRDAGFSADEEKEIIDFIQENKDNLRELSLRMVLKLSNIMRIDSENWKDLAKITCFKG